MSILSELQRQVANAGLRHAADDAGDRDSAKRFQETIARLKGENIGGQRGRRLIGARTIARPASQPAPLLHCEREGTNMVARWPKIVLLKGFAALTDGLSLANSMPGT